MASTDPPLQHIVRVRLARLNAVAQGVATGLVTGLTLFLATLWIVVKDGPVVGPHLALLGEFFIGYHVTIVGSLVGLLYGFACGFIAGHTVSRMYNWVVARREHGTDERAGTPR